MKIRSLTAAAALAASALAILVPSSASAWTCPERFTQPWYITNPVTGGTHQACSPYLNCETCVDVVVR